MAKPCAFCGKSLRFLEQEDLMCGDVRQTVCQDCRKKYGALPMREMAEQLLQFGQPEEPERLRELLRTPEERAAAARQARSTGLTCLRCGGEMLKCGRYPIQLGDEGLLGPVFRDGLMASWMKVDILRCCGCGRAEFFLPEDMDRDAQFRETPGEMVTCPVCGTQHSSLVGCPTCAVKAASGGRVRGGTEQNGEKTSGSKPPWEF